MLTREWLELEYHIDVCRVTGGANSENLKLPNTFSVSCGCENFHYVGPSVLLVEMYVITENIMRRRI